MFTVILQKIATYLRTADKRLKSRRIFMMKEVIGPEELSVIIRKLKIISQILMRIGIFLSLFLFPYVSVLHVYTHIPMLNICFTVDFYLAIYLPLETNANQQNQVCWSSCVCQVEGRLRNIYSVF